MAKRSKKTRIVEGEVDAARYVTVQKRRTVDEQGQTHVQRIVEAAQDPRTHFNRRDRVNGTPAGLEDAWDYDNDVRGEGENVVEGPRKKTQKDYIFQFVQRVDEFLGALLAREARPVDKVTCSACQTGSLAVWRCKDCSLTRTMCRKCMRHAHREDPFHRIEWWNGKYFQSAALCDVGAVIFVPHLTGIRICNNLKLQQECIEENECMKDVAEQQDLRRHMARDAITNPTMGEPEPVEAIQNKDPPTAQNRNEAEEDRHFFEYLDRLRDHVDAEELEEPGDDAEVGDEDDNEVEEDGEYNAPFQRYLPSAVGTATFRSSGTIRVIHTNGIHNIPLVVCSCQGADHIPSDLIATHLWPTSFKRIRTLFTAHVLDQFWLCNLEMNASAYQFYHLLRRVTNPQNPAGVVDLYNEFRRMTRLWRWTKKLKWAGYAGHNGKKVAEVEKGELANYCPACPQPGINLPNGWENDPNKFVYRRVLMADRNFKADHVQPKKPSEDVWLSEGSGMVPKREEYHAFLKTAIEKLTGAPCENTFRAITGAMQASKSCDVTGVVGVACARHGCYAPNSLVDLFKGEQQKNVDFALLAALKSTGVDSRQGLMFLYDVMCQFFVHLKTRIGHLLPEGMDVDRAIGLFHVHAHKDECLFHFSPSFIPGVGRVIGEILEHLWGKMNGVSPTARTATLAHRAEMLDNHATDSNHKKALDMPNTLCRRYIEAVDNSNSTEKYFSEVSQVVSPDLLDVWTRQIVDAETRRLATPKVMDIYAAKGRGDVSGEIDKSDTVTSDDPIQAYLQFALIVEEKEIEIRICVRQLTKSPRHADPNKIEGLRDKLRALLGELERLQGIAGIVEENPTRADVGVDLLDWADEQTGEESIAEPSPTSPYAEAIENHKISQANSHLYKLRNMIAEKSFQYSDVIRKAPRKGMRTRARAKIDEMNHTITFYSQLYTECRARLIALGANNSILKRFQVLKKDDVKTSTAILDPNTPGSTRIKLSWIWHNAVHRFGPNVIAEDGQLRLADADLSDDFDLEETDPETLTEFKRVHWLRARAQYNWWKEEATILHYEMTWTVRYFMHKAEWWHHSAIAVFSGADVACDAIQQGRATYANRQGDLWEHLARCADQMFSMTNSNYKKNFPK
ncbi:hypothetical protein JR316_0006496 [Psilocybe cubensis]|uniref:CxC2-like cysteine cluster KDZ transposase-associated domain-containing protein n=2 Tax=Psilocybe cubensis TaxID=181762 RepID=A0A8H7XKN2_PSICU|nr:hypothetical protein JR316_0006496 [Psilocybe cubensis]KAH9481966.1 hypothetical protein JR316_0006496 [Psilocybe cubensis]